MGKLTALQVKNAKPGRHADGDGLYLLVSPTGAKSWVLRVRVDGKRRDIGLGSASVLKLQDAREECASMRKKAKAGLDPVAERKERKKVIPTFKDAAIDCHGEMKGGWRNDKHSKQWLATLETYAYAELGSKKVDRITGPMIRDVLSPIWLTVPETAKRVRQRICTVLDFAHAKGWRPDEAPIRSVGKGLPKQHSSDRHFAAMPFAEVPVYMEGLRGEVETVGRLALMFTILTAARSGEVRGATWDEVDLKAKLWTVPGTRMKGRKEHIVPLSEPALAVLERAKPLARGEKDSPIFPGKRGRPLSDMTLSKILRDAELKFTVHGFRSSFRDWAAEETSFPGEVVEKALAHAIPNKVEAAYRRTDFLEKRRKLMIAWASYLGGKSRVIRLAATR